MKMLKPTGNRLEKTTVKKVSVKSRLKAIYITHQRKALYKPIVFSINALDLMCSY